MEQSYHETYMDVLKRLKKSKFRSGFHLKEEDILYIQKIGGQKLKRHAEEFIETRLAPAKIDNDGKQTPMKGHPVFIAQHATATCCRGCLEKWYQIPHDMELTKQQQEKIVYLILFWLKKEYDNHCKFLRK